jgi:hypothetical protein
MLEVTRRWVKLGVAGVCVALATAAFVASAPNRALAASLQGGLPTLPAYTPECNGHNILGTEEGTVGFLLNETTETAYISSVFPDTAPDGPTPPDFIFPIAVPSGAMTCVFSLVPVGFNGGFSAGIQMGAPHSGKSDMTFGASVPSIGSNGCSMSKGPYPMTCAIGSGWHPDSCFVIWEAESQARTARQLMGDATTDTDEPCPDWGNTPAPSVHVRVVNLSGAALQLADARTANNQPLGGVPSSVAPGHSVRFRVPGHRITVSGTQAATTGTLSYRLPAGQTIALDFAAYAHRATTFQGTALAQTRPRRISDRYHVAVHSLRDSVTYLVTARRRTSRRVGDTGLTNGRHRPASSRQELGDRRAVGGEWPAR